MTGWPALLIAGLVEIAWSQSIKPTASFTRLGPTFVCLALGIAAVYLLTLAMRDLPVGTAYAVFTGIGAIGAIGFGAVFYDDPITLGRMLALALIVGGVVCARLFEVT